MSNIETENAKESEKQETLARWELYQESREVVSNEAMTEWLDSWGTDKVNPCPTS